MIRFARVLMIAMMAFVLSAAVSSVSAADAGKRGSTVNVQKPGMLATGHLRQMGVAAGQGGRQEFYDQYFDSFRFFTYLNWNFKFNLFKS